MSVKRICLASDVPDNGMKEFTTDSGDRLLVANSNGEYFAVQAICPHQDVPLCEGFYDGCILTCHQHLWQWDIRTGEPVGGIAEAPLERFAIFVEGGEVFVGKRGALNVGELFSGLSEATLSKLQGLALAEEHPAGAVLYQPGDAADDFFVLDSGRIEFQIGRDERTSPAGFMLRKGEVFGWAALLDAQPTRIASARVLEPSRLLRINGKQALAVLEADPASGYLAMRRLSGLIARFLAAPGAR
jgi:toluene monooxygenase system ferredoxin subunit